LKNYKQATAKRTLIASTCLCCALLSAPIHAAENETSSAWSFSKLWDKVSDIFNANKINDWASYFGIDQFLKLNDEIKNEKEGDEVAAKDEEAEAKEKLSLEIQRALLEKNPDLEDSKKIADQYADVFKQYSDAQHGNDISESFDQWASQHLGTNQLAQLDFSKLSEVVAANQASFSKALDTSLSDSNTYEASSSDAPKRNNTGETFSSDTIETAAKDVADLPRVFERETAFLMEKDVQSGKVAFLQAEAKAKGQTPVIQAEDTITKAPEAFKAAKAVALPAGTGEALAPATTESNAISQHGEHVASGTTDPNTSTATRKPASTTPKTQTPVETPAAPSNIETPPANKPDNTPNPVHADNKAPVQDITQKAEGSPAPAATKPAEAEGGLLGALDFPSNTKALDPVTNFFQKAKPEQLQELNALSGGEVDYFKSDGSIDMNKISSLDENDREFLSMLIKNDIPSYKVEDTTPRVLASNNEETQPPQLAKEDKELSREKSKKQEFSVKDAVIDIYNDFSDKTGETLNKFTTSKCFSYWQYARKEKGSKFREANEAYKKTGKISEGQCEAANKEWQEHFAEIDSQTLKECFLAFAAETEMARTFRSSEFQEKVGRLTKHESFIKMSSSEKSLKIKSISQEEVKNGYTRTMAAFAASPILGSEKNNQFACQLITGEFSQKAEGVSCQQGLYSGAGSSTGNINSADANIARMVEIHQNYQTAYNFIEKNYDVKVFPYEVLQAARQEKGLAYDAFFGECSPLKHKALCSAAKQSFTLGQTGDLGICKPLAGQAAGVCKLMGQTYVESIQQAQTDAGHTAALSSTQLENLKYIQEDENFKDFMATLLAAQEVSDGSTCTIDRALAPIPQGVPPSLLHSHLTP